MKYEIANALKRFSLVGIVLGMLLASQTLYAQVKSDFNGDMNSDILFQHSNGDHVIFLMDGTGKIGRIDVGKPTWSVKNTGDFNGDGNSDILFKDNKDNHVIFLMDGTGKIGRIDVDKPTWSVKNTGDFNGDGNSDILFQHSNGDHVIFLMDGTGKIGRIDIGKPTWTVQPPIAEIVEPEVSELEAMIVGQTRYFVNTAGVTGYRSFGTDGTYTGSVTLANGTTLDISGMYAINGDNVIIVRESPNTMTIVLTYIGSTDGVANNSLTVDGVDAGESISFATAAERDAYLAGNYIDVTQTDLNGTVFYLYESDEFGYGYTKLTFSDTEVAGHDMWYNLDGSFDGEETWTLPYTIIEGVVRVDLALFEEGYAWLSLIAKDASAWLLSMEDDLAMDGPDGTDIRFETWFLSKPAEFPAEL